MALHEQNTPLRDRETRVNSSHARAALAALKRLFTRRKHPHIAQINAHIARDIGISPSDLAQHQHRWPSQHTHHPRG